LNKLAKRYKVKVKILKTHKSSNKLWIIYKPDPKGKKVLIDKKVIYYKSFTTKNSAIKFAQNKNIPAIIVPKTITKKHFDINVLGFKSEKDVKKFIKSLQLPKKSVKIIKNIS
jgi:hypothetical protein